MSRRQQRRSGQPTAEQIQLEFEAFVLEFLEIKAQLDLSMSTVKGASTFKFERLNSFLDSIHVRIKQGVAQIVLKPVLVKTVFARELIRDYKYLAEAIGHVNYLNKSLKASRPLLDMLKNACERRQYTEFFAEYTRISTALFASVDDYKVIETFAIALSILVEDFNSLCAKTIEVLYSETLKDIDRYYRDNVSGVTRRDIIDRVNRLKLSLNICKNVTPNSIHVIVAALLNAKATIAQKVNVSAQPLSAVRCILLPPIQKGPAPKGSDPSQQKSSVPKLPQI